MGGNCCSTNQNIIQHNQTIEKQQNLKSTTFTIDEQNRKVFKFEDSIYKEEKFLGSGSFADVYLVRNIEQNTLHALKILKDNQSKDAFFKEYQIMKDIDSQFVIKFEQVLEINSCFCLMMEYANQGTLTKFFENNSQNINPNQIFDIICDIFLGLKFLHKKKIIHRDLKMDNILISDYQIKIADLGVAAQLSSKQYAETHVGNLLYAAPEKINENYNESSDIFSAGLITIQLIYNISTMQILKMKLQNNFQFIQQSPKQLSEFLLSLINSDPKQRPDATRAYQQARKLKTDTEILNFIQKQKSEIGKVNNNFINFENPYQNTSYGNSNTNQGNSTSNFQNSSNGNLKQNLGTTLKEDDSATNQFIGSFSNDIDELFEKGIQLYRQYQISSADKLFGQILKLNPNSIKGLSGQLICQYRTNEDINKKQLTTDEFIQKYKHLLQLNPNFYLVHFIGSNIFDGEEGLASADKCLQLNPNMIEAYCIKSHIYNKLGRVDEALQNINIAIQKNDKNSYNYRIMGNIYFKSNKELSMANYKKSIELEQNDYFSLSYLADIYNEKNQFELAQQYVSQSLSINKYYKILQNQQKYQEVVDMTEKIFKEFGEKEFLYFNLAYCYYELKNSKKALLYYTKLSVLDDDSAIYQNIGFLFEEDKQFQKAKQYYQKAIDKKYKSSYFSMYDLLLKYFINQKEQAISYINQLKDLEFDLNDEEDIFLKLKGYSILDLQEEYLKLSEQLIKKHSKSKQINQHILQEFSKIQFDYNIQDQLKLAQQIEFNTEISILNIKVQAKCLIKLGLEEIALQNLIQRFEEIFNQDQTQNQFNDLYEYIFDELEQKNLYTQFIEYFYKNYQNNFYCCSNYIVVKTNNSNNQDILQIQQELIEIIDSKAIQEHPNKEQVQFITFELYVKMIGVFLAEESYEHLLSYLKIAFEIGYIYYKNYQKEKSVDFYKKFLAMIKLIGVFIKLDVQKDTEGEEKEPLFANKNEKYYIELRYEVKTYALIQYPDEQSLIDD